MAGLEASGQDLLDPSQKKDASLTDFDYKVYGALSKIVGKGFLAKDFLGYMVDYLALNQPQVPIGQVFGFSQYTAQLDQILTGATADTTSTSYTDLSTAGPTLTGLPDGQYLILFGAKIKNTTGAGNHSWMSFQPNATTALDADAIDVEVADFGAFARATLKTLSNDGNNTVTCKYRVGSGTGRYGTCWIAALKYANA